MSNLMDLLSSQLGGQAMKAISQQLGANEQQTQSAVQSALPILLEAMTRNTGNQQGANALANALDKDHDGSVLDDIPGFLSNFQNGPGNGILKHLLGNRRGNAEQFVSKTSGLDAQSVGSLMQMLAPMLMGQLGKQKRQQGLDVGTLVNMLQGTRKQAQQQNPQAVDMIGSLLDKDGDGDYKDEIAQMGMKFLGGLLRK